LRRAAEVLTSPETIFIFKDFFNDPLRDDMPVYFTPARDKVPEKTDPSNLNSAELVRKNVEWTSGYYELKPVSL
jgi:hypothetical protein